MNITKLKAITLSNLKKCVALINDIDFSTDNEHKRRNKYQLVEVTKLTESLLKTLKKTTKKQKRVKLRNVRKKIQSRKQNIK